MRNMWTSFISLMILLNILIYTSVLKNNDDNFKIITCDVGQGDAILVQYKQTQMLVDGGTGDSVLDCLGSHMPFWDTTIELVVLTHPQFDHYGGLIDVFENYDVKMLLATEIDNDAKSYEEFKSIVAAANTKVISPRENMKLNFAGALITIIHPDIPLFADDTIDSNVLGAFDTSRDPNDYSISFLLDINEIEILFTGDIGPDIISDLEDDNQLSDIDILKVPHHGSKNGLTKTLLEKTTPEIAIISAGSKNRFGHPHKEVIDLLNQYNVQIFRTDEIGDVILKTDGITVSK